MKAIVDATKLPKFLVVKEQAEKYSWNKYLPQPYKTGEIVMVAPAEQQVSSPRVGSLPEVFRKQYVKIIRKDKNGKWNYVCVIEWRDVELLKKKQK